MSVGDNMMMPGAGQVLVMLGSGGVGAVIVALINKFRHQEDREAVKAGAQKAVAEGEAAVLTSVASAFTEVTGGLREEIDRLQEMLNDLRQRVVEAEVELRAAAAREADKDRQIGDLKAQLEVSHDDVIRLRVERDSARARVDQLEGENRQLKALADSARRVEAKL